jgi:ketosteroid isomerase-like protein
MSQNVDVVRQLVDRWNAGDVEGSLELYHEDAVAIAGPDWPEQATHRGHDELRANMADWLSVWDSSQIEVASIETYGDKVVVTGSWIIRGRSGGVPGTMPFVILFTLRDGKIAVLEWQTDHDSAVAAARGT